MALRDEIASTSQRLFWEVRVDGRKVPDVFSCSVSLGFDQINAQATLVCNVRPSWADELQTVEIWAGYNGITAQIFLGEISGIAWDYFPRGIALEARGLLYRLRGKWGGDIRTYTSQDDAAVIQNLTEAYGLPTIKTSIESSAWTLGEIEDVVLDAGDTAMSLIERIDVIAGYKTFETSDGVVRRRRITGNAAPSGFWVFQKGVDIEQIKRQRTLDGIVNYAEITGFEYGGTAVSGTAQASNPYIPSPPGTIALQMQDNLVETDAVAGSAAQRIVNDHNRRPEYLELMVRGNPLIQPGMTIGIIHADIETGNAFAFVEHVQHQIEESGRFTTTIKTTGGNLSGYDATMPPYAIFDVKLFKEGEDNGGTVTAFYTGIADGSQSFDPDGSVVTYTWVGTAPGGTCTPYGGTSSPVFRFALTGTAVTGGSIALTVTDADNRSATAAWNGTIAALTITVEDLYTAEGTVVAASSDGQATWQSGTVTGGSVTCEAPFAPSWGEAWGATNGVVYRTEDKLRAGTLINSGTPHGGTPITAVWVHETNQDRIWLGHADGVVQFSDNRGTSWSTRGTIATGVINEIRESYYQLDILYATAGSVYLVSFDGGRTWSGMGTAVGGGTAWRMAAGPTRNWWCQDGGSPPYIRDESGGTFTFAGGTPTGIRGISPGWRLTELYAASAGSPSVLYRSDTSYGTMTAVGTVNAQVNHVLRSGNEDGIVYLATDIGVYKTFRMESPRRIKDTAPRRVQMIAYGDAHTPGDQHAEVLVLPFGTSGSADKLWWYHRGAGWQGITLPVAGLKWRFARVNPFNPNVWIALGNTTTTAGFAELGYAINASNIVKTFDGLSNPLWITFNAGVSWTNVTIDTTGFVAGPKAGTDTAIYLIDVCWSNATSSRWALAGIDGINNKTGVWRGSSGSLGAALVQASVETYGGIAPGRDADVFIANHYPFNLNAYYLNSSDAYVLPAGSSPGKINTPDGPRNSSRLAMLSGTDGRLLTTLNYRTAQPTTALAGYLAGGLCYAGDACYVIVYGGGGIGKISDPFGSPSHATAYALGQTFDSVRSDAQTKTRVVVKRTGSTELHVFDGSVWFTMAGPPLLADATMAKAVEIVSR